MRALHISASVAHAFCFANRVPAAASFRRFVQQTAAMHCSACPHAQVVAPPSRLCARPCKPGAPSLSTPTQSPFCCKSLQSVSSKNCRAVRYGSVWSCRDCFLNTSQTPLGRYRSTVFCEASAYDFDALDLDAPEIDNDLESYQVGVEPHLGSPALYSYLMVYLHMCICRHRWELSLM